MVVHQLGLQGISWEDFISHDFFTAPQVPLEVVHDVGEPSHQPEGHKIEPISVPVFVTYQRGTRVLFAAARRVLSPPRVEGVSLLSSAAQVQVQDRGKRPMQDEGPSGGQDTDFILIDEDLSSPSSKLRETIQDQKAEIDTLTVKLQRAQWIINYLEQ